MCHMGSSVTAIALLFKVECTILPPQAAKQQQDRQDLSRSRSLVSSHAFASQERGLECTVLLSEAEWRLRCAMCTAILPHKASRERVSVQLFHLNMPLPDKLSASAACGTWLTGLLNSADINGTVTYLSTRSDCLAYCLTIATCNAVSYGQDTKCHPKFIGEGHKNVNTTAPYQSYRVCVPGADQPTVSCFF
jgi:hypothetical protein